MKELISGFIDDELRLDEKIDFVEEIHQNRQYKDETVGLLRLEMTLQDPMASTRPALVWHEPNKKRSLFSGRPWPLAVSTALAALFVAFIWLGSPQTPTQGDIGQQPYRFVFYQPDAVEAEIAGNFTDWRPRPMQPAGSGYWELTLELPPGQYRYAYIVDGHERIADPTIPSREKDDFGGQNSVLVLERRS
jgi:hypothetical protein